MTKKKAEAPEPEPEDEPEVADLELAPEATNVETLHVESLAKAVATEEEVAALKHQVEDLTERLRTHFRHHHKFESSVWQF